MKETRIGLKNIGVRPELHRQLKLIATLTGKPLSEISNEAIKEYLTENEQIKNLTPVHVQLTPIR